MRNAFKVFDADAHVIYPPDLWQRYLDRPYVERVGRRQPIPGYELYNPTTVDGIWTQNRAALYGQYQEFIRWTRDDMAAKFGEDLVTNGFTGDHVRE